MPIEEMRLYSRVLGEQYGINKFVEMMDADENISKPLLKLIEDEDFRFDVQYLNAMRDADFPEEEEFTEADYYKKLQDMKISENELDYLYQKCLELYNG